MRFAAIADDYTGGADLAGMLFEGGVRTLQVFGLQSSAFFSGLKDRCQAVVLSLKSRSIPAAEACRMSLEAYERLRVLDPAQVQFKYCSTFDSTPEGNIGPVIEALLDRMGLDFTIAVPALPVNGRTQYLGHLFVNGQLLSETHMRRHPLTPMTDSNLVRHLQAQMRRKVGLIPLDAVREGPAPIRRRMNSLREDHVAVALVDCTSEADLEGIARAAIDLPLITGGSGLAMKLPALWGLEAAPPPAPASSGCVLVLAGSCSAATLEQLEVARSAGIPMYQWDNLQVVPPASAIIYSSAPESERDLSQAASIEHAFGEIARRMVREQGVRKLVVAGGETSGAVVNALDIPAVEITAILDPGVPALRSLGDPPLSLVLKSGNFGSPDFFVKAIRHLQGGTGISPAVSCPGRAPT